jgi:hypothetical protein
MIELREFLFPKHHRNETVSQFGFPVLLVGVLSFDRLRTVSAVEAHQREIKWRVKNTRREQREIASSPTGSRNEISLCLGSQLSAGGKDVLAFASS